MLSLFLKRGYKLLLELPKENIGSLNFSLESFVCWLQINGGFRKFQRNVIHVIAEFTMVIVTVIWNSIQRFLETTCLQVYFLSEPSSWVQIFADIENFLTVLI